MSERVTNAALDSSCANVNRRIASSGRTVNASGRNGYTGLDEYRGDDMIRTLRVGTRREIYDFLYAMMVGIDLSRVQS